MADDVNWSMLGDLGSNFVGAYQAGQKAKSDDAWNAIADNFMNGGGVGQPATAPMTLSGTVPGPTSATAVTGPAMRMPADPATEAKFASTLKAGGLTNPYGLSAMMSHANAESGFSPSNITGSWSDPSQSGQPGTSGGALSWRNSRLSAMQQATAGASDPVAAQAKYALVENPNVTMALQNAKSADEANAIMAQAQGFAGYKDPSSAEYQRRLAGTNSYLGRIASLTGGDSSPAPGPQLASAAAPLPPGRPADLAPSVVAAAAPAAIPAQSGLTADLPGNDGPQATGSVAPAAATPALDAGSLFRLTNGAKVSPDAPATSFVGRATIMANRDLFLDPTGKPRPVGQVMASLNPSAPANMANDASAGYVPSAPSPAPVVASADGYVPAGSGLVPSATRAYVGTVGAPAPATSTPATAAAPAAPAKVDMTGDFPVTMPDGKTWTRKAAAATEADDSPEEEAVEAAQGDARRKAGLDPATGQPAAASTPQQAAAATVAASAASGGPTIPTSKPPGPALPPAVSPADNSQVRQMIGLMLKDPSTRAAGLQAMMNLQTKQAASAPFMFNGNLMQYGADGTLHTVIAAKDDKDNTQVVENPDGTRSIIDKGKATATAVTGLPAPNVRIWGTPGVPVPPGYDPNTPGYYDAKGDPHVGLTSGTDMAAGQKANGELDKQLLSKVDQSYDKSQGSIGTLAAISRQKEAIDNGMTTGWGADWQTQAKAAVAKILGLPDPTLDNSYDFDAASTQKQAELAKAVSQAGHTTNMDLQLGKTIAGGSREKTEASIKRIIDAQETLAKDQITRHNAFVDKYVKIAPATADRMAVYKIDMPDVYQYGQSTANPVADPGAASGPVRQPITTSLPIKIPSNMTPAQVRQRFPSGTKIFLPDGSQGVVP